MHEQPATARRVTIVDVAQRAGVSTTAVSKVLRNAYGTSPEMRSRVRAAVDHLGYRSSPTSSTASVSTSTAPSTSCS
jgi:LacI family transcriptional regulator